MHKIMNYSHVAQLVFNTPLLATGQLAETVAAFLHNKITGAIIDQQMSAGEINIQPVGNPEHGEHLGIVPVHGILVPRRFAMENACDEIMSYELLRTQLTQLLNNDDVLEIAVDLNSGGGSSQGAFEIAEFIYQNRHIKPIRAIVNYNAFSGAYLIAAACTEIIVSETGGVGSIGVYTKRLDLSKFYAEEGIEIHTFYRGARKVDFHPDIALSEEERQSIETSIENTYQKFVNAVARYRGLTVEQVEATAADCFEGQKAIDLGLADRLAVPQDAINQIAQGIASKRKPTMSSNISIQAAHMRMQSQL